MRAALLEAPGRVRLRTDAPVPEPGPGEMIVRVDAALTCGTDLKTIRRGHPLIPLPAPLGHEFAGVVAALGLGVDGFREGDPIACVPTAPCRACRECERGRESLCERAIRDMVFGAFADFVRLPARLVATNVFPRPAGLGAPAAALLEPLACVVHGVRRLPTDHIETALLIGDGPIALLFVQLLRLAGVPRVLLAGRHETRLATAQALGAELVTSSADWVGRADAVIECVGTPDTWQHAATLAAPGGTVLFYGGCRAGATVAFDAFPIHYREVDLRGAFHYDRAAVRTALDLLASGDIETEPIITHIVPLDDLESALELARRREAVKVAVLP